MSEYVPGGEIARLNIDGEPHLMHRGNSALFTHIGELMMYDHIYVQDDERSGAERVPGAYIFRQNAAFNDVRLWMKRHRFPMHMNLTEVADCDREAFERSVTVQMNDLGDTIPINWRL